MVKKIVCLLIILFLVAAAVAGCDFFKRESPQEEVPDSGEDSEETLANMRKTIFYL
jgi:hypothetical protein